MTLTLPRPDDWHVHLRQGRLMRSYSRAHSRAFGRVLAMPNTVPPLTTGEAVNSYVRRAEKAAPGLNVVGCFRLMPNMRAKDVTALAAAGIAAGKYYPDGATTNSSGGITAWEGIAEALEAMEAVNLVLCIHGEDPEAPVMEREERFIPTFAEIRSAFPRLRIILEHVSSRAGVHAVMEAHGPTAATITVQHLYCTLDDLAGGLLDPHLFCKPIVKFDADRRAIAERVIAGDERFFFGSDSAPHSRRAKESPHCPAGAYSAPMALPALTSWFEANDALDRLEPFLCRFGREFYGKAPNEGTVVLERKSWRIPRRSEGCVPLMAGRELPWRVQS